MPMMCSWTQSGIGRVICGEGVVDVLNGNGLD
jgi:hypothetical protein